MIAHRCRECGEIVADSDPGAVMFCPAHPRAVVDSCPEHNSDLTTRARAVLAALDDVAKSEALRIAGGYIAKATWRVRGRLRELGLFAAAGSHEWSDLGREVARLLAEGGAP